MFSIVYINENTDLESFISGYINKSFLSSQNMDRLEFIGLTDPEWAIKISNFLENYPEFNIYRKIAPATKKPVNENEEWITKTLFETILYYTCSAGVRYDYAVDQFKKLLNLFVVIIGRI